MQNVATPLYMDWSFWAVVVAFIAMLLSQLPPIHVLLKKACQIKKTGSLKNYLIYNRKKLSVSQNKLLFSIKSRI
jgi:hypothetical protein